MSSEESLKKITKGAGIFFIGISISKVLTYFYILVVARIGTEKYGLLSLGMAILSIAGTLSLLGLNIGVLRYVSYYRGKGDKQRIRGTITSSLEISFPLSLFFACLMFFCADWISINIFHAIALAPVLKIFAFVVPFYVLSMIFIHAIRAFQRVEYEVYAKYIFESAARILLTIILIYMGYGLFGATVAYALAIFGTFILSVFFLERKLFPIFKTRVKAIPLRRELISYSSPLMISGILTMVLAWTDTLMIGYFRTVSEVGIYRVAVSTATLMLVVPSALLILFMPVITELYAKEKRDEVEKVYKIVTKWVFFANFPVFLLMVVFSKQILNVLFGLEYTAGALALSILALGYFSYSVFQTAGSILIMLKKTRWALLISTIITILNVFLNYYLIPIYGVAGGAVATGFAFLLAGLLCYSFVYFFTKMQPITFMHVKSLISGTISISVVYGITRLVFAPTPTYALILMFGLFLLFYLILLIVLRGFEEEDIAIIKAIQTKTGIDFTWINNILRKFVK